MRLRHPLFPAVLALAIGAACATGDVHTLIGDAACQSDSQCHTIGVGAKACGGPSGYLAWSSARTDGDKLRSATEREAQAQRQQQIASGRASNCMVEQDPGAYCAVDAGSSSGTCRLRSGVRVEGQRALSR